MIKSAPRWKCYFQSEYVAACKYPEDAAILMAAWGKGCEVRFGINHKLVLWREGLEDFSAAETGRAADIMRERLNVLLQNKGSSSEN